MPLDKSGSKASIGKNIATERHAGKPEKQAIAIAESEYRAHGGDGHTTSGMDRAMQDHADRVHPIGTANKAPDGD